MSQNKVPHSYLYKRSGMQNQFKRLKIKDKILNMKTKTVLGNKTNY